MRGRNISEPDVLIFDEDPELRREIQVFLVRQCGLIAIEQPRVQDLEPGLVLSPRIVIIGGAYAEGRGLSVIRRIRELRLECFILYLDRMTRPDEGADAFAAGADDVARLPISIRELGLRLRCRLGRGIIPRGGEGSGLIPQVILDGGNRLLASGSKAVAQLTPAEADVMAVLIRRGGEIVTRDELSREIDNCDWVYGDRKFDVHITKIRKKLRDAFGERYQVRSVRSEGYAFCEDPESELHPF
ncbi:response regulator transcription factor [Thioclava sp. BHET1]|nr:response regulator transcription factor [Thioclava sp. BHET1]